MPCNQPQGLLRSMPQKRLSCAIFLNWSLSSIKALKSICASKKSLGKSNKRGIHVLRQSAMDLKNNGILLVDKSKGSTSFKLVAILRRLTRIEKIGHSGTLDPFATGLMVMLIGREFTKRSDQFLNSDKEYRATVHLGLATDTYDIDGQMTAESLLVPTLPEIQAALHTFQGDVWQIPPMFSAKKIKGQKL